MKQIAWIISPPAKGSGGFRTICSKASFLDSRGYENYFYIMPGCEAYKSAHRVQTEIKDWFGYSPKEVRVAPSDRVGNVGVSAPTADRQTQAAPVLESGIAT